MARTKSSRCVRIEGREEAIPMSLARSHAVVAWGLQLLVAGILLQTLFFKFTGAEESVWIFSTLGAEPWGRIGSGVAELVAAGLLLTPALAPYGAVLTIGLMTGAIMSHLTVLGIEVQGDGGLLFGLALVCLAGSAAVLVLRRFEIPIVARLLGSMV
jgi:hypothetical protein